MNAFQELLRSPSAVAARCREDRDLRELVFASLLAIVAGACIYGAVLGSYRGGAQILFAAAKIPLVLLATLALSAPAFHAIAAVLGRPWHFRQVLALTVAACGRSALILIATAPLLWLVLDGGVGYHGAVLAAVFTYGLSSLAALGVLVRGLDGAANRVATIAAVVLVFLAVGAQSAWGMRPFVVRPQTVDVPFFRAREGSFADAVYTSTRSAAGVYDSARDTATRTGDLDPQGQRDTRAPGDEL